MTVLIVDDQENMCWILSKVLSDAGFSVKTSSTCRKALNIAEETKISAAIIDFRLPDGNGFELFKKFRERDECFPCILITSYGSSNLRKEALNLGFSAYFDKPFDNPALVAAIRNSLHIR
jgi:DNA-binding NtrC family response regulator